MAKILVGSPVSDYHEYCFKEYVEALKTLTYDNYDILLVDNSKTKDFSEKLKKEGFQVERIPWEPDPRQRIVSSRNLLRKKVLEENYDYFLSLEQDVIPPKDIIKRLLSHNKKVITGLYFNPLTLPSKEKILIPVQRMIADYENHQVRWMTDEEIISNKLLELGNAGMGCLLIHKDVLAKIKFRISSTQLSFDDSMFAFDCMKNKIKIWGDTSIKCLHLIKNRPWNWTKFQNSVIVKPKQ